MALGRSANHSSRKEVDHDRQIRPALMGLDVGGIGHPDLVGSIQLELPIQDDARKAGQPGDPVLRNLFPEIPQIVGALAIALNLAAIGPGLPDEVRLARIVLRAAAERFIQPGVEAAEVNPQHPAHCPDAEPDLMRPDKRARHPDSRAKGAFAMVLEPVGHHGSPVFRMSCYLVTRASFRFSRRFSASWSMPLNFGAGSANIQSHLQR